MVGRIGKMGGKSYYEGVKKKIDGLVDAVPLCFPWEKFIYSYGGISNTGRIFQLYRFRRPCRIYEVHVSEQRLGGYRFTDTASEATCRRRPELETPCRVVCITIQGPT